MGLNAKSQDLIFIDVSGFSMWPFLRPGQKLVIKKISMGDLKIGDIVLYMANNQLVCHRLVKKVIDKKKNVFYVRGDNSLSLSEPLQKEMFLGKVMGALRNGKMINFVGWKQQFINRLIVEIAPLVTIFKPFYVIFRKFVRGY